MVKLGKFLIFRKTYLSTGGHFGVTGSNMVSLSGFMIKKNYRSTTYQTQIVF